MMYTGNGFKLFARAEKYCARNTPSTSGWYYVTVRATSSNGNYYYDYVETYVS